MSNDFFKKILWFIKNQYLQAIKRCNLLFKHLQKKIDMFSKL
jgi:hypothetical protein